MKKYYSWVICACCLLLHFCGVGLVATSLSVYMPQFRSMLGLTNVQTSMITTIRCLSTTVFIALAGFYYRKLSLRVGVSAAILFLAAGCLLFTTANSVIICYVSAMFMGVSYALAGMLPITLTINNWFRSSRSTALAIATCGSSLCTVIASPALTSMIERVGLRKTLQIEALFILAFAAVIFLVLRDRPSSIGLEPYQGIEKSENKTNATIRDNPELNRCGIFFLLFAMFLVGVAGSPYLSFLVIHLTTEGYTAMQAASAMSLLGAVMAVGKLIFGVLSDRVGTYMMNYIALGCWILGAVAAVMAAGGGQSVFLLYAGAALGGAGLPIGSIGMAVWTGDLVSQKQYADTIRRGQTSFTVGSLLGTPLAGILADLFGSYTSAYVMYAIMFLTILAVVQILYHKQGAYRRVHC